MQDMLHDVQRKTVNLGEDAAAELAPYFVPSAPERQWLRDLAGADELESESDVLRALVKLGLRAVRDARLDQGYAELAASEDDDDRAFKKWAWEQTVERWKAPHG